MNRKVDQTLYKFAAPLYHDYFLYTSNQMAPKCCGGMKRITPLLVRNIGF